MKTIKFRAFNRITKKMLPNNTIQAICINSERLTLEEFENLELMQFTGFKDKNGVEIFDGDVLRDFVESDEGIIESKRQVFWNKNTGSWHLDCSYKQDKSFSVELYDELSNFEYDVIGNIYENNN